jgi:hypothetical protein
MIILIFTSHIKLAQYKSKNTKLGKKRSYTRHSRAGGNLGKWIPASAGMTNNTTCLKADQSMEAGISIDIRLTFAFICGIF